MAEFGAQSRPASLPDPIGALQQKPTLTSTMLNVLSWSSAAAPIAAQAGAMGSNVFAQELHRGAELDQQRRHKPAAIAMQHLLRGTGDLCSEQGPTRLCRSRSAGERSARHVLCQQHARTAQGQRAASAEQVVLTRRLNSESGLPPKSPALDRQASVRIDRLDLLQGRHFGPGSHGHMARARHATTPTCAT